MIAFAQVTPTGYDPKIHLEANHQYGSIILFGFYCILFLLIFSIFILLPKNYIFNRINLKVKNRYTKTLLKILFILFIFAFSLLLTQIISVFSPLLEILEKSL